MKVVVIVARDIPKDHPTLMPWQMCGHTACPIALAKNYKNQNIVTRE